MMEIEMSKLSACASARHCFPLHSHAPAKRKWIARQQLMLSAAGRVYAMVVDDVAGVTYAMDAITGSLYPARGGECLTSPRLRADNLQRDDAGIGRVLMRTVEPA